MKYETYITLNATNHRNSTCRLQHYIPKEIDLILFFQILFFQILFFQILFFQILYIQDKKTNPLPTTLESY